MRMHLVFSVASFREANVQCGDLESAYFTGQARSWIAMSQPQATACWHAYGTRDAGLRFPKKFRRTLIGGGVTENRVLQSSALFDHRRGARAATCT